MIFQFMMYVLPLSPLFSTTRAYHKRVFDGTLLLEIAFAHIDGTKCRGD